VTPVPSRAAAAAAVTCENEGCEQRFKNLEEEMRDLKQALRGVGGIFDTLKRLELQFVQFTATVTASVRVTVALGSFGGALIGAIASAVAIAAFLKR
jgi:hypothetical protein